MKLPRPPKELPINPLEQIKHTTRKVGYHKLPSIKQVKRFRYPKLLLLLLTIVAAYFVFKNPFVASHLSTIQGWGYAGIGLAGALFAFGFTAPFAVGFLIVAKPENIYLAAIIAGFGALIADLIIFRFIKFSFTDEFEELKKERAMVKLHQKMDSHLGLKMSNYLLYFLAGFFVASPLPDEIGVTMLAGLTHINEKILGLISFTLNTGGILLILAASA